MVVRDVKSRSYSYSSIFKDYLRSLLFLKIQIRDLNFRELLIPFTILLLSSSIAIILRYDKILYNLILILGGIFTFSLLFTLFVFIIEDISNIKYIFYISVLSLVHLPIYIYIYKYTFFKPIILLTYLVFIVYFVRKNFTPKDDLFMLLCVVIYFIFMYICIN